MTSTATLLLHAYILSVADPAGGGKGGTVPPLSSRERHAHAQSLYKHVVAKNVTEEAIHRVRYSGVLAKKNGVISSEFSDSSCQATVEEEPAIQSLQTVTDDFGKPVSISFIITCLRV